MLFRPPEGKPFQNDAVLFTGPLNSQTTQRFSPSKLYQGLSPKLILRLTHFTHLFSRYYTGENPKFGVEFQS